MPVIVTVTAPPVAPTFWYAGDRLKAPHVAAQIVVPAGVTVNVWPPIITVPVRRAVLALAATLSATKPPPVPVAPLVTVIQVAVLVAVRAQPAVPNTVTDSEAPDGPTRPVSIMRSSQKRTHGPGSTAVAE